MLGELNVKYLLTYWDPPESFDLMLVEKELKVYKNSQCYPRAYVPGDGRPSGEPVRIVEYTPNRVKIVANLSEPGQVVLSDVWYPG